MGLIELLLLAVGLSMDAFAVSVCKGLAMGGVKPRHMLICGAWFGGFQALMPMIGYLLGAAFENVISAVSSWIAFGLLVLIGGNMLREALSKDEEKETNKMDVKTMFMLAVATSIDALAGGVFGTKYKTKAEAAGGVILILIGVKILLEHFGIL